MSYQNPIPHPEDEYQSRTVMIPFKFEKPVTAAEAAENLNRWFSENKLKPEYIKLTGKIGICYQIVQPHLGKLDRDPEGYGPKPKY